MVGCGCAVDWGIMGFGSETYKGGFTGTVYVLGLVVDGVFGRFDLAALCGCHTLNVWLCYVI